MRKHRILQTRASLAAKFQLVVVAGTAIAAVGLGGFVVRQTSLENQQALRDRGRLLAENVARTSQHALLTESPLELRQLVNGLLAHPDVAYVRILDGDGVLLAMQAR